MKKLYTLLLILFTSIGFGQTIVKDSLIQEGIKQITLKFDNDIRFDFYYPAEVEFKKIDDKITGYFNGAVISLYQVKNTKYNKELYDYMLTSKECTEFNSKCDKLKNNYYRRYLNKKDDILEYVNSHDFLYEGGIISILWVTEIKRDEKILDAISNLDELSNILSEKAELREHYYYFYK